MTVDDLPLIALFAGAPLVAGIAVRWATSRLLATRQQAPLSALA